MRMIKQAYTQEPHSALSRDEQPLLELELVDAGGGEYVVLRAEHWAMDADSDAHAVAEAIKALLAGAKS